MKFETSVMKRKRGNDKLSLHCRGPSLLRNARREQPAEESAPRRFRRGKRAEKRPPRNTCQQNPPRDACRGMHTKNSPPRNARREEPTVSGPPRNEGRGTSNE